MAGEQRSADPASLFLAAPPLPTAASSQWLCPAPVFLTCFLSLFLMTALGLLLGTAYLAKMCQWGKGQVYSSSRREHPCGCWNDLTGGLLTSSIVHTFPLLPTHCKGWCACVCSDGSGGWLVQRRDPATDAITGPLTSAAKLTAQAPTGAASPPQASELILSFPAPLPAPPLW